jgi:hypothetical protein
MGQQFFLALMLDWPCFYIGSPFYMCELFIYVMIYLALSINAREIFNTNALGANLPELAIK